MFIFVHDQLCMSFLHNIIAHTVLICVLNSRLVDALMGPLIFLRVHHAWTLKAVFIVFSV